MPMTSLLTRPPSTCGAWNFSTTEGDCSFETILRHYEISDPVLWDVARIVHEADLADDRYDAPEAAGLDAVCRGLSMVRTDEEILAATDAIFDGLYEYRRRALLLGRDNPA